MIMVFSEAKPPKARSLRSRACEGRAGDYATVAGRRDEHLVAKEKIHRKIGGS